MKLRTKLNHHRVWTIFFGIWLVLLSGMLDFWFKSPGLKQWYRVGSVLDGRRQEIADVEARSGLLIQVSRELLNNPSAQEREIRKVLGYLGEQEVVFEFSQ